MKRHVLIIDDDEVYRDALKRAIDSPGAESEIREAVTGREAIALFDAHKFDLVFIDYTLPDMDAIEVLKTIYDPVKDITPCPVVMMTAQGSQSVMIDALNHGAQDYIVKEYFSKDALDIVVEKATKFFALKVARNNAEEQLLHSQKMDAVGKLTGGIAHDFNNLLSIIFGNTRLLEMMLEDGEPDVESIKDKVKTIRRSSERGADLVKQLMIYSRQRTLNPVTTNINDVISDCKEFIVRSLNENIEVKTSFDDELHSVEVDPIQLEHAIINMPVNASDVMPDGGVLSIETYNIPLDHAEADALNISEGEYIVL